jgi:hypothetical protein
MATAKLDKKLAQQAVKAVEQAGSKAAAARLIGVPVTTLKDRLVMAERDHRLVPKLTLATVDGNVPNEADQLRDRVRELETAAKAAKKDTLDDDYVKRKIIGLTESMAEVSPPSWALRLPKVLDLPGIPSVMWSDWHWGETVFKSQINGVNEFNLEIANRRARKLVEKTVMLLNSYEVKPDYPGIVVNLGGDMLTGDIHDELSQTNDVPNMVALLDLFGALKWALSTLADEFGNVFVPCVTGNHGRNTKKPQAKHRNFTNFDWLLYQFLARHFEGDARIRFYIPDGSDASYKVFNHRYLLTHGDQFRGGDGIIGALGPILRGRQKKQSRNSAIALNFDTMIIGHWHQYLPLLEVIVNGSLKGYDEYAQQNNFGFQLPIQALWTTHHRIGINNMRPIYLEGKDEAVTQEEWVSWRKAA